MSNVADGYGAYYAGKLWSLLPEIYRTSDPTNAFDPTATIASTGPLRELVNRIGAQAATLRRSIDRMWEDQSIDGCDDWVIGYIGAQLATNLVASLDPRAQRLDVANTIYYRERTGTIPILEQIAANVTGWDARVIELYRRLGRARHELDLTLRAQPPLPVVSGVIGPNTGTPAGGYADLRDDYGASRTRTAFDEFAYTLDARLGQGTTGWYNIPKLGVFLWRLLSVMVEGVTPVAVSGRTNEYTFDPTGRDVPLFAAPLEAYDANWIPRQEYQLPVPIDRRLLEVALPNLYAAIDQTNQSLEPNALGLFSGVPSTATLVPLDQISAAPDVGDRFVIDPARGRVTAPAASSVKPLVSYRYGFASTIGAGGYDRRIPGQKWVTVAPVKPSVTGGGSNIVACAGGTVEIADSLTYDGAPSFTIGGKSSPNSLLVQASNLQRPLIRFTSASTSPWLFTGTKDDSRSSRLRLDGLFVSGGDIVLAGSFDEVSLSCCTLDPGAWHAHHARLAADGEKLVPVSLQITGAVKRLVIDRCILGPITTAGSGTLEQTSITNSILQTVAPHNPTAIESGMTTVGACTLLGEAHFRQLEASDSIFAGRVVVADNQQGCVRYSAWTKHSVLPSQYASVELEPDQQLFGSTAFGDPHYAQLLASVDPNVRAGAENGLEMGAFSRDKNPIKERSLLIKYGEFMPLGLTPVLIYVT